MTRLRGAILPLLACACIGPGGGTHPLEPVDERDIVAFAERISGFYQRLEKLPLNSLIAFEDPELRSYFEDEREFSDYFASVAAQVREASLRHTRAERVLIREFRFADDGLAEVDITLEGRHKRGLRWGLIELQRTDTWRRVGGTWSLTPDKL